MGMARCLQNHRKPPVIVSKQYQVADRSTKFQTLAFKDWRTLAQIKTALLPMCFRFHPDLLKADADTFRRHCYVTLLKREPEIAFTPEPSFSIADKIYYWRTTILSNEFLGKSPSTGRQLYANMRAGLGWRGNSPLFDGACRFYQATTRGYPEFIAAVSELLAENSLAVSGDDLGDLNPDQDAIMNGLIDMAVEYAVGLDQIQALETRLQALEKRLSSSGLSTLPPPVSAEVEAAG